MHIMQYMSCSLVCMILDEQENNWNARLGMMHLFSGVSGEERFISHTETT